MNLVNYQKAYEIQQKIDTLDKNMTNYHMLLKAIDVGYNNACIKISFTQSTNLGVQTLDVSYDFLKDYLSERIENCKNSIDKLEREFEEL